MGIYEEYKQQTGIFSAEPTAPKAVEPAKEGFLKRAARAVLPQPIEDKIIGPKPVAVEQPKEEPIISPKTSVYEQYKAKDGIFASGEKKSVYNEYTNKEGVFAPQVATKQEEIKPEEVRPDENLQQDGFSESKISFGDVLSFFYFPTFQKKMYNLLDQGLKSLLNKPEVADEIKNVAEVTKNLPLKGYARLKSIGDKTYEEAYNEAKSYFEDPNSSEAKKFLYGVQNTVPQTAIGVLLSVGSAAIAKSPTVGKTIAGLYWSTLSADEQLQEKNKIYSIGNIAIDTIGDSILGNMIEGLFKKPVKTLTKTIAQTLSNSVKGAFVEGGTEVAQTFLKLANDYRNSTDPGERQSIVEQAKQYVKNGDILREFGVAAVAGGLISGGASAISNVIEKPGPGGEQVPEEKKSEVQTELEKNIKYYREGGGFSEGTNTGNAPLRDINNIIQTPEGKQIAEQGIQSAIDSGELKVSPEGTVTVYRAGEVGKTNELVSTTLDKEIAQKFIDEAEAMGRKIPLLEFQVKPEDIALFIGKGESEVLVPRSIVGKEIISQESSLIEEAKKYKSAEEFIDSFSNPDKYFEILPNSYLKKPKVLYRGEQAMTGLGTGSGAEGFGLYTTTNKKIASTYAKLSENGVLKEMPLDSAPTNPLYFRGPSEVQSYIQRISKNMGMRVSEFNEKIGINKLVSSMGYDGIAFQHGTDYGTAFVKFPKEDLINKSKLTDIWNKAQEKTPETKQKAYPTFAETLQKGEDIVAISRTTGKISDVKFIRSDEVGIMAKEPISGLPMRFRYELFDFRKKPIKGTQKERVAETVKKESKENFIKPRVQEAVKEIRDIYLKSESAQKELDNIKQEMEFSEPGRREYIRDEGGVLQEVVGVPSSFPSWVPEELRSKDLFSKVMKGLESVETLSFPEGNRPKQRELYNEILDELDERLQTNTKGLRNAIIQLYENRKETSPEEAVRILTEGRERIAEGYEEPELRAEDIFGEILKNEDGDTVAELDKQGGNLGFKPKNLEDTRSAKASAEYVKIVKRSQIAKDIERKFLLPIRRGKFRMPGALAIYKPHVKLIRYKSGGTPTIFHEVGHFIDDTTQGFYKYFMARGKYASEREVLLTEYGNPPSNMKERAMESFAEFVRYYYTDKTKAQRIAPGFFAEYEKQIALLPEIKDVMDTAAHDYNLWLEMPSVAKVYSQISFGEKEDGTILDKIKDKYHRLYETTIDDLHPLKVFSDLAKKNLGNISPSEDPYVLARILRGWHGKAEAFLEKGTFGRKFFEEKGGNVVPKFNGESFRDIVKPAEEAGALADLSTYLIAKRAVELSKRGITTGISRKDAIQAIVELEEKHNKLDFIGISEKIYKYNEKLLQYANESGLISGSTLAKIMKLNQYYVPFFRVMDEAAQKGYLGKGIGNVSSQIKKIKGSDRDIIDPLESIVKNTYAIMNAAERNNVAMSIVNLSSKNFELGRMVEPVVTPMTRVAKTSMADLMQTAIGMSEAEINKLIGLGENDENIKEFLETSADIFRPSFFTKDNTITVLINGKKKFYQVDPDLYRSIQALDAEDVAMVVKILSYPAKFLRAGATLAPEFIVRNPARDQTTAFVYSKYGYLPVVDLARGVFSLVGKDSNYWLWRMGGGEHSSIVALDRASTQERLGDVVADKGVKGLKEAPFKTIKGTAIRTIRNPLRGLQILSELGEAGTRLGEMKKALKKTKDPVAAAYAAREITLDFARIGSKTKAVNMLISFWNANVQGTDKMIRAFKEKPYRTTLKTIMGITLPSILLYMANRDDDRWKEIPQWQKDMFWIVMTDKHIYRIPKPFELGIIFGSLPERILEYIDTHNPDVFTKLFNAVRDGATPGFVPTAILPIWENISNYSMFLNRNLVSDSMENLPQEAQYNEYTSEFSKMVGQWMKYSPIKIDNLIKGYFAGLGNYVVKGIDEIIIGTGVKNPVSKPAMKFEDLPVFKAFMIREPVGSTSESVNQFYEKYNRSNTAYKYFDKLLKNGKRDEAMEFLANNPEAKLGPQYAQVADYMSSLRQVKDGIMKSTKLSPEEKRVKVDKVDKLITQVAQKAIQMELKQK